MKKSENDKKAKKERGDVDTIISLFCALVIFIRVCIRFLQAGYVYGVEIRNKNDKKHQYCLITFVETIVDQSKIKMCKFGLYLQTF